MLELRTDVRPTTQVMVLPQVVARACLLELDQEELETRIREEVERNPALELAERTRLPSGAAGPACGELESDLFARLPAPTTLADDLRWQLRAVCRGELRRIGDYIIDNLDARGYLSAHVFDLAEELQVPQSRVEAALKIVQRLEPVGVGARNLVECLQIQAAALPATGRPEGLCQFLATEFAAVVEAGDPRALRSPRLRRYRSFLNFIREHMHPYPADLFQPPYPGPPHQLPARTPDVVVARDGDRLVVSVPMSERLTLRVEAAYENLAKSLAGRSCRGDRARVKQLVAEAREFIGNLTHRHTIIARVAAAVVREQRGYLAHGPRGLRSLTKKELSQSLGLHESVICRATKGKTVMLPDGETVPFEVFFEDALPAKVCLAQIIRHEEPTRPLTDTDLVAELARHGYHVARRTVSKYRAALGIAAAPDRRRR